MKRLKINILRCASVVVAMLFVSAFFIRCASIGTLTGGPVDSLPPVIVEMTPDNFTTNMDTLTRRIYIEFNEFVNIKEQQKEFYTSPKMKNAPQITTRGRGIVVTLRDTLKKNTTYALNFGSSIRDNNEDNPLYSMRYVFSTGDEIDSMILSGYTEDAYKADSVSGTFLLFYPQDSLDMTAEYDSTIFNATPAAIARAESNGIALAQNLKPIPYQIYALEDTNGNMTYEPGVDRVGFLESSKNPADLDEFAVWLDTVRQYVVAEPQLHFRIFMDKPFRRQMLSLTERPLKHKAMLYFGAEHPSIDSIIFDSLSSDQVIMERVTEGADTLALWFNAEVIPDTLRGRIVYQKHDSLSVLQSVSEDLTLSWRYIESKEERQEREREERAKRRAEENGEEWEAPERPNLFGLKMSKDQEINPERSLIFDFDYPIAAIDSAAITLQALSAKAVELRDELMEGKSDEADKARGVNIPYRFVQDTMNLRRWHLTADWHEEGSEYYLTIPKGAVRDIAGLSNDSITYEFTPLKRGDFATIVVNVGVNEERPSHYILELLNGGGRSILESKSGVEQGSRVQFNYVPAGAVMMRVIEDVNNNGRWDSGDLVMRRQPEFAKMVESDGEREMATKVNWEIEIDVDPKMLFTPETQEQLARRLAEQDARKRREEKKKREK